MHSFVISKNVKWCHLIWPTLYIVCASAPPRNMYGKCDNYFTTINIETDAILP